MAYNKSKFVEAAQKLLNQGKVAQAIAEYQQILKYEPRDQVTLMTIGELYIRQGETLQAIDYFERLAQLFVSDGFLTKAIAVYKRIAKLAPEEIRPLEKLADLYVQQGVMSEARPLFLQLAELHLKNNRQPEAISLLKKLLSAEPDNLRIQVRLADLYQAMGQSGEALETYVSAAQRALARGDHAECEKLAEKALHINPNQLDALIVKARAFSTVGNVTRAAEILERVPDLEKGGEPAELLLDLYLKNAKWDEATALALRIFSRTKRILVLRRRSAEVLMAGGQAERAMSLLSRIRIPMIDAGEHEGVASLERACNAPAGQAGTPGMAGGYLRTDERFLPHAGCPGALGDAFMASGKLERAKEVFQQLVDREPESEPGEAQAERCAEEAGAWSKRSSPTGRHRRGDRRFAAGTGEGAGAQGAPRSGRGNQRGFGGNVRGLQSGRAGTRRRDAKVYCSVADRRGPVCQLRIDAESHRVVGSDFAPRPNAYTHVGEVAGFRARCGR